MGMWKARIVLVTGANRGIGLEFVKLLKNIEQCKTIVACCRNPSSAQELNSLARESNKVIIKRLEIDQLAEDLKRELSQKLDLLINNAGVIYFPKESATNSEIPFSIQCETSETLVHSYRVNVVGPFLLTRALIPLMTKDVKNQNDMSIVFNLSSTLGSIQSNTIGRMYNYRLSKAALNMLTKNFGIDLAGLGIMCVACHPGWVKTEMGGPNASIDTKTSVTAMLDRIRELTPEDNGKFIGYDNTPTKY